MLPHPSTERGVTDDDGDTNPRRYDAFWAFRNRWLVTNIARVPERCSHESTYDTSEWSRCLSCCHVVRRPGEPAEPSDLEKHLAFAHYLYEHGDISG